MSTRDYGNQVAYDLATRHPAVSSIVCWVVILSELAFVGVVLVPPVYAPYLILLGVIHHGVIAVVTDSNLFFFSFLAAYPPLVLTAVHLHALLGGSRDYPETGRRPADAAALPCGPRVINGVVSLLTNPNPVSKRFASHDLRVAALCDRFPHEDSIRGMDRDVDYHLDWSTNRRGEPRPTNRRVEHRKR